MSTIHFLYGVLGGCSTYYLLWGSKKTLLYYGRPTGWDTLESELYIRYIYPFDIHVMYKGAFIRKKLVDKKVNVFWFMFAFPPPPFFSLDLILFGSLQLFVICHGRLFNITDNLLVMLKLQLYILSELLDLVTI